MPHSIKMSDLARAAGVSTATVSRVLKNQPGAAAATRQRILRLSREMHYTPSPSAQELAYRRIPAAEHHNVGIVRVFTRHTRDYGRAFYSDINDGLRLLNDYGYELITSQFENDDQSSCPERLLKSNLPIDGVVFVGTAPDNAVEFFHAAQIPVVQVDREPIFPDIAWVATDNVSGVHELMNHLLDHGHERIAYIRGAQPCYSTRERFDAYRCALLDRQFPLIDSHVLYFGTNVESVSCNSLEFLRTVWANDFTAAVCENDIIAIGLMRACIEAGISIPEKLSIAGIDDSSACQYAPVPLTTVHIPGRRVGESAAKLLVSLLRNMPIPSGKFTLPTHLVVRASCRNLIENNNRLIHTHSQEMEK